MLFLSVTKAELQENIVKLYLRLNGYITNSLIIHSSEKFKNKSQIDIIAVRFPFHAQDDRIVGPCQFLQIPANTTDVIIGEVKGGKEKNQFNESLRKDVEALTKLIKWLGVSKKGEIPKIVKWLQQETEPKEIAKLADFPALVLDKQISLRPIVFNVDDSKLRNNKSRFVPGQEMLNYIWKCFRPASDRLTCSVEYPKNMWGPEFTPIVTYFKDQNRNSVGKPEDLYKHFGV